MNSCELLFLLQKEASNLSSGYLASINEKETGDIQSPRGTLQYNIQCLSRYNLKKFELKRKGLSENI
ncbi:MAG: hypothetical protein R2741_14810 [Methanolobus sp.]